MQFDKPKQVDREGLINMFRWLYKSHALQVVQNYLSKIDGI